MWSNPIPIADGTRLQPPCGRSDPPPSDTTMPKRKLDYWIALMDSLVSLQQYYQQVQNVGVDDPTDDLEPGDWVFLKRHHRGWVEPR